MNRWQRQLAAAGLLLTLAATGAEAGGFDVKGAEITKGETEISVNSAYFSGFPINADLIRATGEIAIGYGFSDWWKAGLKLSFDKPVDASLEAVTAGIEAQLLLRKLVGRGPAIALFAGVDFALRDDQTNTLTFGPLWQWALDDKTGFAVNTLFSRTFGQNRTDATDFSYAWQLKRELSSTWSVGIEGYGVLPDIGHTPGVDFQEHRIGPVVYLTRSLAHAHGGKAGPMKIGAVDGNGGDEGPKLNVEAGVLFGLTDATQDRVYKLKGAITF